MTKKNKKTKKSKDNVNIHAMKAKMDDFMYILKEENPYANWKNLVTGLIILILVLVFSISYFSDTSSDNSFLENLKRGNAVVIEDDLSLVNEDVMEEVSNDDSDVEIIVEDGKEMIVVEDGEGLWQVAERVCGDSDKYIYLAEANNLNIRWAPLKPGDKLILSCGE